MASTAGEEEGAPPTERSEIARVVAVRKTGLRADPPIIHPAVEKAEAGENYKTTRDEAASTNKNCPEAEDRALMANRTRTVNADSRKVDTTILPTTRITNPPVAD